MATDLKSSQLKSNLECGVCLNLLDNPKDLVCGHTFCKDCIDGLLKFKEDGSADISCPNRCKEVTYIDAQNTANDLRSSYILKTLLYLSLIHI